MDGREDHQSQTADHHGGADGTEDHHGRADGAETPGRDWDLGESETQETERALSQGPRQGTQEVHQYFPW